MMQIFKFLLKHAFHQSIFLPFYQMSLDHKLHFDHKEKKSSISTHNLYIFIYLQACYAHTYSNFYWNMPFINLRFFLFIKCPWTINLVLITHIHTYIQRGGEKKYAFVTSCGLNRPWNRREWSVCARANNVCGDSRGSRCYTTAIHRVSAMTVTRTMTAMTTLFQLRPASRENNASWTSSRVLSIRMNLYFFCFFFFLLLFSSSFLSPFFLSFSLTSFTGRWTRLSSLDSKFRDRFWKMNDVAMHKQFMETFFKIVSVGMIFSRWINFRGNFFFIFLICLM